MPGGIIYWQVIPFPKISAGKGKLLPPLESERFTIRVLPPYGKTPKSALVPLNLPSPKLPSARKQGLCVVLVHPAAVSPGPITVRAFLEHKGHAPMALRLTGDPQLDFMAVQIHEPGRYVRGIRVLLPKPHWVFPKLPPPLTAYGKWLVKHPPKKLPEKTYDLKPGVVYKYAVPINLSCQYDMSLRGKYHVRIELAHPKIWSNWATVTVP